MSVGPICGKRHGMGIERCELPAGHDRKPRKGLRPRSEKQQEKVDEWTRIKEKKMREQKQAHGYTFCTRCGRTTKHLELHHKEYAGRGGEWTEDNAELICAWPESQACHEAEHGTPQWTGKRDRDRARRTRGTT